MQNIISQLISSEQVQHLGLHLHTTQRLQWILSFSHSFPFLFCLWKNKNKKNNNNKTTKVKRHFYLETTVETARLNDFTSVEKQRTAQLGCAQWALFCDWHGLIQLPPKTCRLSSLIWCECSFAPKNQALRKPISPDSWKYSVLHSLTHWPKVHHIIHQVWTSVTIWIYS